MKPRDLAPVLLLVVLVTVALQVPNFATERNITSVLLQSVPLLLVTAGQTLVIATAGIDLSVGETVTLAAIVASFLMGAGGSGVFLGIGAALLVGVVIGLANATMIGRFRLPPFLATLAMMFCLDGVNLFLRPVPGGSIPAEFRVVATAQFGIVPVATFVTVLCLGLLAIHLRRSRVGLRVYAVGADEKRARLAGVDPLRVKTTAYVACSVIAACTGLFLAARIGSGDPNIGSNYAFNSLTAAVLGGADLKGGRGTLWGAIAAAFVLSILANAMNLFGIVAYAQWIAQGLILILAVAGYSLLDMRWSRPRTWNPRRARADTGP